MLLQYNIALLKKTHSPWSTQIYTEIDN